MKCLNENELILFYWKEVKEERQKKIENHLKECDRCLESYKSIVSLFARVKSDPPQLSEKEVDGILQNVKAKIQTPAHWNVLKDKIDDFSKRLRLKLTYQPQLVPVAVVLAIVLAVIPFIGKRQAYLDKEFDILQVQVELSLDNPEGSLFDLYYADDLDFLNGTSSLKKPTHYS